MDFGFPLSSIVFGVLRHCRQYFPRDIIRRHPFAHRAQGVCQAFVTLGRPLETIFELAPLLLGSGQFFLALRIDGFMSVADFKERIDAVIDQIHGSALAEGTTRIFVPGEIEDLTARERTDRGIPLEDSIISALNGLLEGVGGKLLE